MLPYHHNPQQDHVRLLSSSHNHCPTFLIGSLTTLLIGHLATLQLGDHLEFYVTLTGALKIPIFKCIAAWGKHFCCLLYKVLLSSFKHTLFACCLFIKLHRNARNVFINFQRHWKTTPHWCWPPLVAFFSSCLDPAGSSKPPPSPQS